MPSIKGTASVEDARALNKALRKTKFPKSFAKKLIVGKINRAVVSQWIEQRITASLGFEDEIVQSTAVNLFLPTPLEDGPPPQVDPRKAQIDLAGFLGDEQAATFCAELWEMLLDAQDSASGIPSKLVEEKKQELALAKHQQQQQQQQPQQASSYNNNRHPSQNHNYNHNRSRDPPPMAQHPNHHAREQAPPPPRNHHHNNDRWRDEWRGGRYREEGRYQNNYDYDRPPRSVSPPPRARSPDGGYDEYGRSYRHSSIDDGPRGRYYDSRSSHRREGDYHAYHGRRSDSRSPRGGRESSSSSYRRGRYYDDHDDYYSSRSGRRRSRSPSPRGGSGGRRGRSHSSSSSRSRGRSPPPR